MNFSREQLEALGYVEITPGIWHKQNEIHSLDTARSAKPEPAVRNESVAKAAREKSHPARFLISVESRRRRLVDPDNLCPKYFIDCLRYAELIPDDSARFVEVRLLQLKVARKEQEGTQVTVTPIYE